MKENDVHSWHPMYKGSDGEPDNISTTVIICYRVR